MSRNALLADLERALDLLIQVDESKLGFAPDPTVSPDVHALTGISEYPVESHKANLRARIAAVAGSGEQLESRNPSKYVSDLIVACVRLAPASDD